MDSIEIGHMLGEDLTMEMVLRGYRLGIFPMASTAKSHQISWIEPIERGVLPLAQFHCPKRLARTLKNTPFRVRFDTDFHSIMKACQKSTDNRPDTWINGTILRVYEDLFQKGYGHCVGVYEGDELVGGLYGLSLGRVFFGESMVSFRKDVSKIAMAHLCVRLVKAGFEWLDTQFVTSHLEQFGVKGMPQEEYAKSLADLTFPDNTTRFLKGYDKGEVIRFLEQKTV